jgi:hypothetical protein
MIFLTEAGVADRFELVVFADGDDTHKALRARMEQAGVKPSFPAAEFTPGQFMPGSDELIARFAKETGVDPEKLPLLKYYSEGVFPRHVEMYQELKKLKGA